MESKTSIISLVQLFNGLPEDQLEIIAGISVEKDYSRGETIFFDGDECDGFYIVASGTIKVFKVSPEGKEQIFHILGKGEPFGEVPVFTGDPFPANAQAIKKSNCLFFPREAFIGLISENPSLALNMLGILSLRLRQFTIQVENLSLKEVPGRLAAYLLYLDEEQSNNNVVELKISKGQLASLLGTIPETLSRIFAKMSAEGLIEVEGKIINLIDPDGLEDLSANGKI